jgi:hypothetical protein
LVVTVTEIEPPVPGKDPNSGASETVAGPAAWVTENDAETLPAATTTVPDRAEIAGLTGAVTDNATPLAPEVRPNDTHDGDEDTDHNASFVVTVVLTDPPVPGSEPEVGDKDTVACPPACEIANDAETPPAATTTVPDRAEDKGLIGAAIDNATPLAPEVRPNDTHDGDEDTDHDA